MTLRVPFTNTEIPPTLISIVLPAHNEEAGIILAIDTLSRTLEQCEARWEIVIVDDGSRDQTFAIVSARAASDDRIRGVRFSRNFGKEAALLAGIKLARGDAVITMDADLQHPPNVIPQLISAWRDGAKVVHAVKQQRDHDSRVMKIRAWIFNKTVSWLGGINIQNSSDFKLMDRVVVDVISRQLPERQRFYRGLADWVGYKHVEIPFSVAERNYGEGKWSLFALLELAMTALVSFTSAPLRIVTIMGSLTLVLGLVLSVETLWSWFQDEAVSGFATIILTLLIIGSFIMISLGIIGEYIAKIYEEVKARPVYLIDEVTDGHPNTKPQPDKGNQAIRNAVEA